MTDSYKSKASEIAIPFERKLDKKTWAINFSCPLKVARSTLQKGSQICCLCPQPIINSTILMF